jgi:hypothetical protein
MSTAAFPSLPLIGFPKRTPIWSNRKPVAISGKETAIADWSYPRWQWDYSVEGLRQAGANQQVSTFQGGVWSEFATLAGFYNLRNGGFDSFLYTDPDDNTVAGQGLGSGDGTTTAFQLVRAFGGFSEPIWAPNTVTAVYLAGVSIPSAGIAAPAAPSLSQVAGSGAAGGTRYTKATYVTNSGETAVSAESGPLTVAANSVQQAASPAASTGAIGWNVYSGTSSGGETKQNATPIAIGTAWTEPTSGLIAGSAMPAGNTTGWSVSTWGATSPGVVTFQGAVKSSIAVTADFSFYWPCRFVEDKCEFEKILGGVWACKKLSFMSIK